jgi:hypothetical protein
LKKLFKAIIELQRQGKPIPEELKEAMSFGDIRDKLIEMIDPKNENGGRMYRYWISMDCVYPDHVIVEDEQEKKYYRVDYTVDAQESVTVGQWQEVEQIWQPKPGSVAMNMPDMPMVMTHMKESAQDSDISGLSCLMEAQAQQDGKSFRVTVIRPGWNVTLDGKPGDKYYTRAACTSLVPLLENRKAYADHPTKQEENLRPERSIRDLVGYYNDARQETDGRVTAVLNVIESASWLRSLLKEAPHLVGPSINGHGFTRIGEAEGRKGKIVDSITSLRSVDIVTEAGAGGSVDQLIASAKPKEDDIVDWTKITLDELRQNRPDMVQAIGQDRVTEAKGEFQQAFDELKESVRVVAEENKSLKAELATERTKAATKCKIGELLRESKLPEVSQRRLATLLEARDFTKEGAVDETTLKEAVDAAIAEEREYLSKLTESGRITGMGGGGESANPIDRAKSIQDKLDKMFGLPEAKPAGQQ